MMLHHASMKWTTVKLIVKNSNSCYISICWCSLILMTGGELSCCTIVLDGELYIDMNGKIDNTP